MIQIDLNDEDIKALRYERYHHPHSLVQRKMEALLLKSERLSHSQICELQVYQPILLGGISGHI